MFDRCDFLLGEGNYVAIVIPAKLPSADTYTVSISEHDVKFRAGHKEIAHISYFHADVFQRVSQNTQIGLVEYPSDEPFPDALTAIAYVELRRASP